MIFQSRKIAFYSVYLLLILVLISCVNDIDTIKKVTYDPKSPDNVTQNLEVKYTDSGYAKIQLFAKLAETYTKPESIMKLKDGLRVNFFSDDGKIVSYLTALYGEINYTKGIMYVRDSVQLYNIEKQQRLETEELIWNQKDSLIYTNKSVIVRTKGGILFGDGIRTQQDFEFYEFIHPKGKINFDKEKSK